MLFLKRQEYKLLFLWSRLLAFDEYDRAKVGQLFFVDFLELLARCADIHAERSFRSDLEYKQPLADSLTQFLEILLTGIATHCGGKLVVIAPGNSNNGKIAADLSQYVSKNKYGEDKSGESASSSTGTKGIATLKVKENQIKRRLRDKESTVFRPRRKRVTAARLTIAKHSGGFCR